MHICSTRVEWVAAIFGCECLLGNAAAGGHTDAKLKEVDLLALRGAQLCGLSCKYRLRPAPEAEVGIRQEEIRCSGYDADVLPAPQVRADAPTCS